MNCRGNGSRFDLCLIVIPQLDGLDFGSGNRFPLPHLGSEEATEDGKDDSGQDAGTKDEEAKDERDEFRELGSLDRTKRIRSRRARSWSRFWGRLARSELALDTGTRGGLSRSQGGLGCLIVDVVNVNGRKLVGQLMIGLLGFNLGGA